MEIYLLNKNEIKELKKEYKERIKCHIQKNLFEQIFTCIETTYKFYLSNNKLYFGPEDLLKEIKKLNDSSLDNIGYLNKFNIWEIILIDEKIYISKFLVKLYKKNNKVSTTILSTNGNLMLLEKGDFYTLSKNRKFLLEKPSILFKEFLYVLDKNFIIKLIKEFYLKKYFSENLINDFDAEDFEFLEINMYKLNKELKFYTKKQLIEYICENTTKYNLNRLSFKVGYTLLKLKPYINDDDFENLYKFSLSERNNLKYNYLRFRGKGLFCTIIQEYFKYKGLDISEIAINEYLFNILKIKEEKVCFKKTSVKKLYNEIERIRNIYILKFYKKTLVIPKNINKYLKLPKEFVLLRKTKDIIKEVQIQKNCLGTYLSLNNLKNLTSKNKVKYVLIYYTIYNQDRYTIFINYYPKRKNKFKLKIIKGFLNHMAPKELEQAINEYIKKSNEVIKKGE